MCEQQMEARPDSRTEHRCLDAPQIGLSGVLASLCGVADLDWSRVSDFSQVPAASDRGVSRSCPGGDALQGKKPPWIWSLCACNIRGERRSARQVCLGFPARSVRRNRTVGYRFTLEYVASTGKSDRRRNTFRLSFRKNPRTSLGEQYDHKKENRSLQRGLCHMQGNHRTREEHSGFFSRGSDS